MWGTGKLQYRALRRLPAMAIISALISVIVVAKPSDIRTVMICALVLSVVLFLGSLVLLRKAWVLRLAASIVSSVGIATGIGAAAVDYLAVGGAVLPIIALLLFFGAPGDEKNSGPKWDPLRGSSIQTQRFDYAGTFHLSSKLLAALDAYLLLLNAITFQFVAGTVDVVVGGTGSGTGTGAGTGAGTGIFILSFCLSIFAVILIGVVASGHRVGIARRIIRISGLVSQVYVVNMASELSSGVGSSAVRITSAVVVSAYLIPASL